MIVWGNSFMVFESPPGLCPGYNPPFWMDRQNKKTISTLGLRRWAWRTIPSIARICPDPSGHYKNRWRLPLENQIYRPTFEGITRQAKCPGVEPVEGIPSLIKSNWVWGKRCCNSAQTISLHADIKVIEPPKKTTLPIWVEVKTCWVLKKRAEEQKSLHDYPWLG